MIGAEEDELARLAALTPARSSTARAERRSSVRCSRDPAADDGCPSTRSRRPAPCCPSSAGRRARARRPLHQAGDLQPERRRVDDGMAVVLRREELILRRERTVDLADVDDPPVGAVIDWKFSGRSVKGTTVSPCARAGIAHSGMPRDAQPRHNKASFQNLPASTLLAHAWPPSRDALSVRRRRVALTRVTRTGTPCLCRDDHVLQRWRVALRK